MTGFKKIHIKTTYAGAVRCAEIRYSAFNGAKTEKVTVIHSDIQKLIAELKLHDKKVNSKSTPTPPADPCTK